MSFVKRWTSGLISRIDTMVAQIEDHDGLVLSTIREVQTKLARAQVQLSRVQQDGVALERNLESQREAEAQWKQRAIGCLNDDERAFDCLRRRKTAARRVQNLQVRLDEHRAVESRLAKDVRELQEGLRDLKEQRNLMRARQTRAEAMTAVRDNQGHMVGELHELMERWEIRIKESEIGNGCSIEPIDRLEESFCEEEERLALQAELEKLRRSHD